MRQKCLSGLVFFFISVHSIRGQTCSETQANSDIFGQDLENRSNQPIERCCSYCAETPGCRAFSWNNYKGGTCWLKSAKGPVKKKHGVSVGTLCKEETCSESKKQIQGCGSGWKMLKQYSFNDMNQIFQDWDVMVWSSRHVNNELQAYTNSSDNIFIRNNNLVIRAVNSGKRTTSGRLESKQLFTPNDVAGNKLKVEFTATVPAVMGAWPALWMLGANGQYGPQWPLNGEIDVMEWVWQLQNKVKTSLHWKSGTDWGKDFTDLVNLEELRNSFITYGVEYSTVSDDQYIQFYIRKTDGQTFFVPKATPSVWTSSFAGNCKPNCPPMAPFDAKMTLVMNLAVGGEWGGCCGVQSYEIFKQGVDMEISAVNVCVLE